MENKRMNENVNPEMNERTERIEKKTKNIKKVLAGMLVAVVGAASYLVYDNFFHYEEVDLFSGQADLAAAGYNGEGVIEPSVQESYENGYAYYGAMDDDEDYDDEDYDDDESSDTPTQEEIAMSEFAGSVTYSFDKSNKLSNGDKVTVTAKYDKDLAKKAKIKVKDDKKSFTVSGLKERFKKDGSDIPKKDIEQAKSYCQTKVNSWAQDSDYTFGELKDIRFVSRKAAYLPNESAQDTDEDSYSDSNMPVYKDGIIVTFSYKEPDFWDDKKVTKYGYMWIEGLNKDTDFGKLCQTTFDEDSLNGQESNIRYGFDSKNEVEEELKDVLEGDTVTKL